MEVENVNVKNWKSLIKPSKLDVQISDDLTFKTISVTSSLTPFIEVNS